MTFHLLSLLPSNCPQRESFQSWQHLIHITADAQPPTTSASRLGEIVTWSTTSLLLGPTETEQQKKTSWPWLVKERKEDRKKEKASTNETLRSKGKKKKSHSGTQNVHYLKITDLCSHSAAALSAPVYSEIENSVTSPLPQLTCRWMKLNTTFEFPLAQIWPISVGSLASVLELRVENSLLLM